MKGSQLRPLKTPAVGIKAAAAAQNPGAPEDKGQHQGKASTFKPKGWGVGGQSGGYS